VTPRNTVPQTWSCYETLKKLVSTGPSGQDVNASVDKYIAGCPQSKSNRWRARPQTSAAHRTRQLLHETESSQKTARSSFGVDQSTDRRPVTGQVFCDGYYATEYARTKMSRAFGRWRVVGREDLRCSVAETGGWDSSCSSVRTALNVMPQATVEGQSRGPYDRTTVQFVSTCVGDHRRLI